MIICLSLSPETKASSLGSNQAPDIRGFSYPVQSLINADREENDKPEKNSRIEKNRFIFFLARRLLFFFLAFHRPSVVASFKLFVQRANKHLLRKLSIILRFFHLPWQEFRELADSPIRRCHGSESSSLVN